MPELVSELLLLSGLLSRRIRCEQSCHLELMRVQNRGVINKLTSATTWDQFDPIVEISEPGRPKQLTRCLQVPKIREALECEISRLSEQTFGEVVAQCFLQW